MVARQTVLFTNDEPTVIGKDGEITIALNLIVVHQHGAVSVKLTL